MGHALRRPRVADAARERALLDATLEVLRERGYDAMSMDDVALRGRCSKATLYRQWGSKAHLVATAVRAASAVVVDAVDTGTLRGDLVSTFLGWDRDASAQAELFAAVHHAALTDPALAEAARTTWLAPRVAAVEAVVERARQRGEVAHVPAATAFLPVLLLVAAAQSSALGADCASRFVDDVLLPALRNS